MKRPVTVTIAAISVVVLMLLSAVWPLVGGDELLGLGYSGAPGGSMPPGTQGDLLQGIPPSLDGTEQSGMRSPSILDGTTQSGDAGGQNMGEAQNGEQNQPGVPAGIQPNSGEVPSGDGTMPIMRILQYALYALMIVCGLIAFGGLWTWKRWGIVMAVITSVIVIVMSAVSYFGMISIVMLIENIVKILIALAVIVLVLLPGSKVVETEVK